MTMETQTILVASTAHAESDHEIAALNSDRGAVTMDYDYGIMVYTWNHCINDDPDDSVEKTWCKYSKGIQQLMRICFDNGYEWLRLDCDGDIVDGVQTYDW